MKKWALLFCLFTAVSMLANCASRSWTPQQRNDFETKCSQTVTVSSLAIGFRGFADNEFSSITVKEYNSNKLLATFKVDVPLAQGQWEKENKSRRATIQRTINLAHTYEFIVPGQKAYRLTDMKMIMWAQYTMNSEGWGCVMGEYSIDGVPFKHDATPTFTKR